MKEKAIKTYQKNLHQALQTKLDTELYSTIVHWHGYPAIRFSYANWSTDSDVVLFLDGRNNKSFCINYYSSNIINDTQREIADTHFKEQDCREPWNEVRNTCRCYKAYFNNENMESINFEIIQLKLAHKLKLMDKFEYDIRPSLK